MIYAKRKARTSKRWTKRVREERERERKGFETHKREGDNRFKYTEEESMIRSRRMSMRHGVCWRS
jgi:hypothetical protein